MNDQLQALAMQLFFVSVQAREFENDAPPQQWSPMRAAGEWGELAHTQRAEWIAYAKKIAPFCGIEVK